jgi:hypothetical protein
MYKYTAVIIEPRQHKALSFVLNNFLENLSDEWGFIIFHGDKNKVFLEDIIENELGIYKNRIIKLINLNIDNLTIEKHDLIWKSKEIYHHIDSDIFLIFQTDTLIIKENKDLINSYLKYDYVGAPWQDGIIGNGGLSLRNKNKMCEIIEKVDSNFKKAEDEFFSMQNVVQLNRPIFEKSKAFSVETVFHDTPFGVHKCWKYISLENWNYLIEKYPILIKLKYLNILNPDSKSCPFSIYYKINDNNFIQLERNLIALRKYLDFSCIYSINIYIHDIYFSTINNIIDISQIKDNINVNIFPLHYNYHGYIKQMVAFGESFKECKTEYIVLLNEDYELKEPINVSSLINKDGKIEWKYMKKEMDPYNQQFSIWNETCENSNKCSKNEHYSTNDYPYIFTKRSLLEAHNKFIEMHNCDYENYCSNKCHNRNIIIEDSKEKIFNQLSKVFNEIEYIANYCHKYSNEYKFDPIIKNSNLEETKKFTIVYKTYKNDLQWIEYSLLSLQKNLDFSNIYELIIYSHDVVYFDIVRMLEKMNMNKYVKNKIIPVHYNYHGYIKQMEIKANCYKDCESEYIILLDSDLLLKKPLNFDNLLKEDGKIEWKYLKKEDNPSNSVFTVWNRACEDSNKCQKNVHYMSNGFPFIFTKRSLQEASNKFIEMHNCDYETYCLNRCGNYNIKVGESTTHIFDRLSQVFTEFEYLGYYCHHFSNDYIFTTTPYCKMDAQFRNNNEESYFIQNWSHGGIDNNAQNIINQILNS